MSAPVHLAPGVALRLLAAFLITAMSALVHALAESVPVGQIIFCRSAFALIPIMSYVALRGNFPGELIPHRLGLHFTRGLLGVISMALSFLSLAWLPVANATALGFLAPVLSLPLAAWTLGERIAPRFVMAVGLGFAGVLAMLWEALEMPGTEALWGIAAGLAFALTTSFVRVHIKAMTKTEAPASIALTFAVTGTLVGLATAPFGWVPVEGALLVGLIGAGLLGGLAHIAATEATARASVAALAAFDFTGMAWALGFDILLFATFPGPLGLAGVTAIALAALMVSVAPRASRQGA
ncbi:DMT family transporter [Aliiruegeria lutimaris]|uniref:EamA domain-containing membrane protein RarD n=1 Tax=Aliiruegeria lutimaris TaxID=571298 RepID=A0A1G8QN78_9RHOB|nr:DMT family transporter [Aliiruegeria lutimaris]SDJ06138.1 EamA domain-containing membrane protein RarD [Aliiruegeria lutimaris]